ncbi:MAG: capsule biosynthesis protein CapK, partial [Planctomycetes bacterium]|nr:capsule biosynthesis protein CapK [Planctomycetota bacterium]
MPAPRSLVRSLFYPLHERLRGRSTLRHFRAMRRRDAGGPEDLQAFHDATLVAHLKHAAATVPFYRERVDADRIECPGDLARFPVIDKATVREHREQLLSEAWTGKVLTFETGGSSGEPLRFHSDLDRESSQLACKLRARAWWGLHPGHRETDLWGSPIETAKDAGLRRVVASMLGFQLLPAFQLNAETMATFRDRLARGRADFLYGYASALGAYARFLEGRGEDLLDLGLELAICTAETLLDADREVIARRLAPPANEYGCRDGGLIAHDDPSGHLRLMHDAVHVEVVDEAGEVLSDGEEGEVVLTNLWARAFPMIRYRVGDRIVKSPEPPSDGLPHPTVDRLAGRSTDFLVATDGTRVHALGMIYILREIPGIARFRVVQESRARLVVLIVPEADLDRGRVPEDIVRKSRRVLGADEFDAVEAAVVL